MKINFGVKIVILYSAFVVLILTLVFLSFNHKVDLVAKDYYSQELQYQDRIDAINNAEEKPAGLTYQLVRDELILTINPGLFTGKINGEVLFFRPSDSEKDMKFKMEFSQSNRQIINTRILTKGAYKLQLSWSDEERNYYKDAIINID